MVTEKAVQVYRNVKKATTAKIAKGTARRGLRASSPYTAPASKPIHDQTPSAIATPIPKRPPGAAVRLLVLGAFTNGCPAGFGSAPASVKVCTKSWPDAPPWKVIARSRMTSTPTSRIRNGAIANTDHLTSKYESRKMITAPTSAHVTHPPGVVKCR